MPLAGETTGPIQFRAAGDPGITSLADPFTAAAQQSNAPAAVERYPSTGDSPIRFAVESASSKHSLIVPAGKLEKAVYQQPEPLPSDPESAATGHLWTPKPMSALGVDITVPAGRLPPDQVRPTAEECNDCLGCGRGWCGLQYYFAATGLCYHPLYFEEINLERYGYGCHPCLQPAASAAHFFATTAALPYLMAVDCPTECNYTLGHYRPGNCVPWRRHCYPGSFCGGLSQAGAATALIFLLP